MPVYPTRGVNISDADAAVGEVAAPKTFYSIAPPKKTGTMANVALDPTLNAYPAGYHAGAPSLTAVDADLVPADIRLGTTIFGVVGTMVQWVYDVLAEQNLVKLNIPVPSLVMTPVESHVGGGFTATPALSIPVPSLVMTPVESHVGGGFTATPALSIPAPSLAIATAQPAVSAFGAGVAHNEDVGDTDETAQTNSAAVNDMDLLPAVAPATLDGFYFGMLALWDGLTINVGQAGIGTYTIAWKYWNGVAWAALTLTKNDTTNHFKTAGMCNLTFVRPGDWALTNIAALGNKYYIKAEGTLGTMTTQPKGTQAWGLTY